MTDVVLVAPGGGDPALDALTDELTRQRLFVRRYPEAREALDQLDENTLVAMVCDASGPGGFEAVRTLIAGDEPHRHPLLVLTAPDDLVARVVALELGADDTVSRPWSAREVALRVRTLLRRWEPPLAPACIRYGPLLLDPSGGQSLASGRALDLGPLEARLLVHLASRQGARVGREELEAQLWNEADVGRRRLDTVVKRLRHKLRGAGVSLATIRGAGFRLELETRFPSATG